MSGPIIPELAVSDWRASLAFYRDILGFEVAYARPEEGFAFLRREAAELMIDEIGLGRTFDGGHAPSDHPFGRGLNLEIPVSAIAPLVASLAGAGVALFLPIEEKWYRRGGEEVGVRQFVVADPDGYLLRFAEPVGVRPVTRTGA